MIFSKNWNPTRGRSIVITQLFFLGITVVLIAACSLSPIEDVTPPPSLQQLTIAKPTSGLNESVPEITVNPSDKSNPPIGTSVIQQSNKQYVTQIIGKIINNIEEKFPPNIPITLTGFNGMVETYKNTITIETLKPFIVNNIVVEPGWFFVSSIDWGGVTYSSNMVEVKADGSPIDLSIVLYGTTKDTSILQVDRLHISLEYLSPDVLKVIELYYISNNSMKMLIPEKRGDAVVPFSVPKNAANLQFQDGYLGERYIPTDYGFADTVSVPPGQDGYRLLYAFELPYQQKIDFTQQVLIPIRSIIVMMPVEEKYHQLKIKSDLFQEKGVRKIQGIDYRIYSGESLSDGDKMQMILLEADQIASFPKLLNQIFFNSAVNFRLILGVVMLIVVLTISGIWLYKYRKLNKITEKQFNTLIMDVNQYDDPNELMDIIMALDDLYKAGELTQSAYQVRRSTLKMHLQEINKEV